MLDQLRWFLIRLHMSAERRLRGTDSEMLILYVKRDDCPAVFSMLRLANRSRFMYILQQFPHTWRGKGGKAS